MVRKALLESFALPVQREFDSSGSAAQLLGQRASRRHQDGSGRSQQQGDVFRSKLVGGAKEDAARPVEAGSQRVRLDKLCQLALQRLRIAARLLRSE